MAVGSAKRNRWSQLVKTGSGSHTVRSPTVAQGIPPDEQVHVQYPSKRGHGVQVKVQPRIWYWLPTDEILDTPEILEKSEINGKNPAEPEPEPEPRMPVQGQSRQQQVPPEGPPPIASWGETPKETGATATAK